MHPQLAFISACLIDTQGSNEHDGKSGRGRGGGPLCKGFKTLFCVAANEGTGRGEMDRGVRSLTGVRGSLKADGCSCPPQRLCTPPPRLQVTPQDPPALEPKFTAKQRLC